jgi:hypothetical protein
MVVVVASCGVVATVIGKFEFWKIAVPMAPSCPIFGERVSNFQQWIL